MCKIGAKVETPSMRQNDPFSSRLQNPPYNTPSRSLDYGSYRDYYRDPVPNSP